MFDAGTPSVVGGNVSSSNKAASKADKRMAVKAFLTQKKKIPDTVITFSADRGISTATFKSWILLYCKGQLNDPKKSELKKKVREKEKAKGGKGKGKDKSKDLLATATSSSAEELTKFDKIVAGLEKVSKLKRALTTDEQVGFHSFTTPSLSDLLPSPFLSRPINDPPFS